MHDVDDNQEATAQSVRDFQAGTTVTTNRYMSSPSRNVTSAIIEDDTSQAVSMCNRPVAEILAATNTAPFFILQKHMQVPRQSCRLQPGCYFTWRRSLPLRWTSPTVFLLSDLAFFLLLDALLTKPKTKIQTKADINIQ